MKFNDWLIVREGRKELAQSFKGTLDGVPQDPQHHPEGDALIHTQLVRRAIPAAIQELQALQQTPELGPALSDINFNITPEEMQILVLAAWCHDIGKATATQITTGDQTRHWTEPGPPGKITSIGHQDREHFEPQLKKLAAIAPPQVVQTYQNHKDLIDFLILHHMDLMNSTGFSREFLRDYFADGKVRNTTEMKLLLILMWSDKMGRTPETIARALQKNVSALQSSLQRHIMTPPPSVAFGGTADDMAKLLAAKPMTPSQRKRALMGKFPNLAPADLSRLVPENFRGFLENTMQPTIIPAQIPVGKEVRILANALKQGDPGVEVYIVGGAVRDWLHHQHHGKPGTQFSAKDEDLTTNLSEEEILAKLRTPYAMKLGIRVKEKESVDTFGVVFASINGGGPVEIAPFRKDIGGSDGRRPDRIERGTIHDDAMRRDLTMNNLYYDFEKGVIIDLNPNGQGVEDVKAGHARPVGDAAQRFKEDVLRVLRLVRFFSRFNSGSIKQLDPQTLAAIEQYKNLYQYPGITPERIQMEFLAGIKQSQNTSSFLQNLNDLDLMKSVFPGMNVDAAGFQRLGNTKNPRVIMAWILRNNQSVAAHLNRLKYPNEISEPVEFLINSMNFGEDQAVDMVKARDRRLIQTGKKKVTLTPEEDASNQRTMAEMHNDIVELSRIIGVDLEGQTKARRMQHLAQYQAQPVSGQELMQQGFAGQAIGQEQKRRGQEHYAQSFKSFK